MLGGLVTIIAGHLIQTAKLRAVALALFVAAAASLLFAFVFALIALRHWIAVTYDTQYPDLWIASGFVVLAIPLGLAGYSFYGRKPKTNPVAAVAMIAGPSLLAAASRRISPRAVGIGVLLVGAFALGRSVFSRPADDA